MQTGSNNNSDAQQLGGAAGADSFVTQNGDHNGSTLNQDLGAHQGRFSDTRREAATQAIVKQKDTTIVVPP